MDSDTGILNLITEIKDEIKDLRESFQQVKEQPQKRRRERAPDRTDFSVLKHTYQCEFGRDIMAYINLSMSDSSPNVRHNFASPKFQFADAEWYVTLRWSVTGIHGVDLDDVLKLKLLVHCSNDSIPALFSINAKCIREGKVDKIFQEEGWSKFEEGWLHGHQTTLFSLEEPNPLSNAMISVTIEIEVYHEIKKESQPQYDSSVFNLGTMMKNLRNESDFCDTKIRLKNEEELQVHRAVLACHSPVFKAMFSKDFQDHSLGEVNFEDSEPEVVRTFVDYLYTGNVMIL